MVGPLSARRTRSCGTLRAGRSASRDVVLAREVLCLEDGEAGRRRAVEDFAYDVLAARLQEALVGACRS